jgi:hypothetical protein
MIVLYRWMRRFIICIHSQISLGRSSQGELGGRASGTLGKGEENVQGFVWKVQREETTWKTKAYMAGWDQKRS